MHFIKRFMNTKERKRLEKIKNTTAIIKQTLKYFMMSESKIYIEEERIGVLLLA